MSEQANPAALAGEWYQGSHCETPEPVSEAPKAAAKPKTTKKTKKAKAVKK